MFLVNYWLEKCNFSLFAKWCHVKKNILYLAACLCILASPNSRATNNTEKKIVDTIELINGKFVERDLYEKIYNTISQLARQKSNFARILLAEIFLFATGRGVDLEEYPKLTKNKFGTSRANILKTLKELGFLDKTKKGYGIETDVMPKALTDICKCALLFEEKGGPQIVDPKK